MVCAHGRDHIVHGAAEEAILIQMHSRPGYSTFLRRLEALCGGEGREPLCSFQVDSIPTGLYACASLVHKSGSGRCAALRGALLTSRHMP